MKTFFLSTLFLLQMFVIQDIYSQLPNTPSFPSSMVHDMLMSVPSPSISYYTGTINTTIPLFEIKTGNINLPISLNYIGSGGLCVTSPASWVGMGWGLDAGGVVSCTVLGAADEIALNNYHKGANPPAAPLDLSSNDLLLRAIAAGGTDAEPDIFNYSYPGGSGQFFFKPDGSILFKKASNIQINYSNLCFTIVDEHGNIYKYTNKEFVSNNDAINSRTPTSSWFLTSITDHNKQHPVFFSYDPYYTEETTQSYAYQNETSTIPDKSSYTRRISSFRLRKISYDKGSIEFVPSLEDRKDVSTGQKYLDQIIVNDYNNKLIKKYVFKYIYNDNIPLTTAETNYNKLRLRLTEIQQITTKGNTLSYTFDYNSFYNLPQKDSYNYDYWGFANGSSNLRPDPKRTLSWTNTLDNSQGSETVGVANREADQTVDAQYVSAGILTKVHYPTGGELNIQYEPNTIGRKENTYTITTFKTSFMQYYDPIDDKINELSFEVKSPSQKFRTTLEITSVYWDIEKRTLGGSLYIQIIDKSTNKSVASTTINHPTKPITSIKIYNPIPPGHYKVVFSTSPPAKFEAMLHWSNEELIVNKGGNQVVGGVRVKKTILKDNVENKTIEKIYSYNNDNGVSSGALVEIPRYEVIRTVAMGGITYNTGYKLLLHSVYPIFTDSRNHISYSQVSEMDAINGIPKGKIVYKFISASDHMDLSTNNYNDTPLPSSETVTDLEDLPNSRSDSRDVLRGHLTDQLIYKTDNGSMKLLSHTKNRYIILPNRESNDMITGLYVKPYKNGLNDYSWYSSSPYEYEIKYYNRYQNEIYLTEKTDSIFESNGTSIIYTDYSYKDGYYTPTQTTTHNSSNESIENHFYYSFNTPDASSTNIKTMLGRNILYTMIDAQKFLVRGNNKSLCNEEIGSYNNYSSNLYLSKYEKKGKENTQIQYPNYDNYGNIIYSIKNASDQTVYLWGYKGQYPIAQINNATYDQVKAALGGIPPENLSAAPSPDMTKIDALRKTLPNAQVSTYTYLPLVGLLTATDPSGITTYYNYDDFGRLQETYLMENSIKKVLKHYNYHYSN